MTACDNYDHSNGRCILEDDGEFIEFWFNNQKQQLTMPVTPFYNMDNDRIVYMKQGLYHCRLQNNCPYSSSDPPLSIYHDGMEFTVWSDVLSRIKITNLDRINGQDRVLTPVYQLTQSGLTDNPDWKVYRYVWGKRESESIAFSRCRSNCMSCDFSEWVCHRSWQIATMQLRSKLAVVSQ